MHFIKNSTFNFIQQYSSIPGILHIQEVPKKDNILVFIDNKKFKTYLPSEFEGMNISIIDLRKIKIVAKTTLSRLRKSGIIDAKVLGSFQSTLNICNELLT